MQRSIVYGLITATVMFTAIPVWAQSPASIAPPATSAATASPTAAVPQRFVVPTPLLERMITQLQLMAAYMGGSAARETGDIVTDLQGVINQQLPQQPAASPVVNPVVPPAVSPPVTPEGVSPAPNTPPHK